MLKRCLGPRFDTHLYTRHIRHTSVYYHIVIYYKFIHTGKILHLYKLPIFRPPETTKLYRKKHIKYIIILYA